MRRFLLVVLCLVACKHKPASDGQSFHDGVQALCDVPDHVPAGDSYEKRLAGTMAWADANIQNPEVKQLGGLTGTKEALVAAARKANVAPCKLADNGMALQSFAEALEAVCAAPPSGDPASSKRRVLNPEVIELLRSMDDASPADRVTRMQAAVARAGLGGCAVLEKIAAKPIDHAPTVTGVHFAELAPGAVSVLVSPSSITVANKPI